MAEPILPPDHPLQAYFSEMLDDELNMPGYLHDLPVLPPRAFPHPFVARASRALAPIVDLILTHLSSPQPNPLSEQLKFRIISSSLLSAHLPTNVAPSVTSPSVTDTPRTAVFGTPDLPGKLRDPDPGEERRKEGEEEEEPTVWVWACLAAGVSAVLGSWFLFLALQLACLAWSIHAVSAASDSAADMSSSVLDTVDVLIDSAQAWDAVLSDALALLSQEDSVIPYDPSHTPPSPTASLRSVLRDALRDTADRSNTVRSLLTPMTDAGALRLLGEMYAPTPSRGIEPSHGSSGGSMSIRRSAASPPLIGSSFGPSRRGGSVSGTPARQSRNRMSLAVFPTSASTPPPLTDMTHTPDTATSSRSDSTLFRIRQPTSPRQQLGETPMTPPFARGHSVSRSRSDNQLRGSYIQSKRPATFPVDLQPAFTSPRARQRSFSNATSPTPSSLSRSPSLTHILHAPTSPPSTLRGPRRRASVIHRLRNPLSLASISSDLSTALDARRWTSAHLLALRFEEQRDGKAYWEDVRDVLRVWASALGELASGVREAVEEAAIRVEEHARAPLSPPPTLSNAFPSLRGTANTSSGFAPSTSPTARFLDKVDAVSALLGDMQAQVARSTAVLRQWNLSHMRDLSLNDSADEEGREDADPDPLGTFDALRAMFACALREYERGRSELVVVLGRQKRVDEEGDMEEEGEPALVQDHGSASGSDEHAMPISPPGRILDAVLARSAEEEEDDDDARKRKEEEELFDFSHPGIEQVFEESGAVAPWTRERSTLSREERIARARQQRANPQPPPSQQQRGLGAGPGPEVVRELKDVIRKVGERRLALVEKQRASLSAAGVAGVAGVPVAPVTPPVSPPSRVLEASE